MYLSSTTPKDIRSVCLLSSLPHQHHFYQCLAKRRHSCSYFLNKKIIITQSGPFVSLLQMGKEKLSHIRLVNSEPGFEPGSNYTFY